MNHVDIRVDWCLCRRQVGLKLSYMAKFRQAEEPHFPLPNRPGYHNLIFPLLHFTATFIPQQCLQSAHALPISQVSSAAPTQQTHHHLPDPSNLALHQNQPPKSRPLQLPSNHWLQAKTGSSPSPWTQSAAAQLPSASSAKAFSTHATSRLRGG
jgi:hypothetical protein